MSKSDKNFQINFEELKNVGLNKYVKLHYKHMGNSQLKDIILILLDVIHETTEEIDELVIKKGSMMDMQGVEEEREKRREAKKIIDKK